MRARTFSSAPGSPEFTVSVAPFSLAIFSRFSSTSTAITLPAPMLLTICMTRIPMVPTPTTITVEPGSTPARVTPWYATDSGSTIDA